jgi:predicted Zn-dependent protease with MMP-like domain
MNETEFRRAVEHAIDELPRELRQQIANVAIVIEDYADADTLAQAELDDPLDLFGFYHGIPLTARTHDYGLVPPDKISLYRKAILAACANDDEVREMITRTVRHEIAHYFGIDDERLDELGAY